MYTWVLTSRYIRLVHDAMMYNERESVILPWFLLTLLLSFGLGISLSISRMHNQKLEREVKDLNKILENEFKEDLYLGHLLNYVRGILYLKLNYL